MLATRVSPAPNAVATAHADSATMGQLMRTAIARYGARQALADDAQAWTYDRLGIEIAKAITVLRAAGLARGDGIAILSANRCELVAVEYAAMLMGVRYTALHPMAARETHHFIIADSSAAALLVDASVVIWPVAALTATMPDLRTIFSFGTVEGAVDIVQAMAAADTAPLLDDADPGDVVRLFYTGGTTGKPKGVKWTHRVMLAVTLLQGVEWELPLQPNFLAATPVSHASGAIIPTVLSRGGRVRLTKGFGADRFCDIVRSEGINCTFLVPTMIYVLLDHIAEDGGSLDTLDTIMYGAAPMSPDRLLEGIARLGRIFCQLYGQTESPMCIATLRKGDHDPADTALLSSCGYPSPLVSVALLDPDGSHVPPGERGEICVRGPLVSDGYWNRPDVEETTFAGGWLHTGDVAIRSPRGFLTIVDRTGDLIITGGFNVYPSEVEDVLNANSDIALSAVVGTPDAKWGEAVTAFIVPRPGRSPSVEQMKASVREQRGAVWVPKTFRMVEELPLTPIGKIDRKALRALVSTAADAPVPAPTSV